MSSVLGKFQLIQCNATKVSGKAVMNEETQKWEYPETLGVTVKFQAVQDEVFGPYTPYGSIEMTIANPAAAAIFRKAWDEYLNTPGAKYPVFMVPFVLESEYLAGHR